MAAVWQKCHLVEHSTRLSRGPENGYLQLCTVLTILGAWTRVAQFRLRSHIIISQLA